MNDPGLLPFFLALCEICTAAAVVGCVFTLLECCVVLRFPRGRERPAAAQPPVTILKPLHDDEPGLLERLALFCKQDYAGPVQLIFGTQQHATFDVVRELEAQFPDTAIKLAVITRSYGSNGKVSNLVSMQPLSCHDTVLLSDSDIVVGPDYLRRVTALLEQPNIGAVTCLYHGIADDTLWSRLSALAINAHFLPQAVLAACVGLAEVCCGATIALRRSMLDRFGGFIAFADTLADDYAIGLAVRSTGYRVVTAPFLVGHRCFEASLRQLVLHQLRVARTIRSIEPIGYAGSIITHPWPLAVVGMLSGSGTATVVAAVALLSRLALCGCVKRRFGLARQDYWLVPLHDIIAFAVYAASFFGATVNWQGADYRVTTDGTLIEQKLSKS
jgi:ceramide glucosyltransferase